MRFPLFYRIFTAVETPSAPEFGSLALLLPVAGMAGTVLRKRRRKV